MKKLVVNHLSRKRFTGDVCGGQATVNFLKNGKIVHVEQVTGKCLTKYVRTLPDIDFDAHLLQCDEATSFIYSVE